MTRVLGEFPVVFLSFDEPWADTYWTDLKAKAPHAKRIHGVAGLDASHKSAADAAGADWFLTIDADSVVDPALFEQPVPDHLLNDNFRLDWFGRNSLNGLVTGNGCVKLWPRSLVQDMQSHEAAPDDEVSLDHDIGTIRPDKSRNVKMPGCFSRTDPANTPYHAFRCGFREGVFLGRLGDALRAQGEAGRKRAEHLARILRIWCMLGRQAENGLWAMYGARLALRMRALRPGWDVRRINDYSWFETYWSQVVLPRFEGSGRRCLLTHCRWNPDRLDAEVAALGTWLNEALDLGISEVPAQEAALVIEASAFASLATADPLDAVGWAFRKGRGVAANDTTARSYFEIATVLGHPGAMNNLARLHDLGRLPDADPAEARRLYRAATAHGNRYAPSHLADMLANEGAEEEAAALRDLSRTRGREAAKSQAAE